MPIEFSRSRSEVSTNYVLNLDSHIITCIKFKTWVAIPLIALIYANIGINSILRRSFLFISSYATKTFEVTPRTFTFPLDILIEWFNAVKKMLAYASLRWIAPKDAITRNLDAQFFNVFPMILYIFEITLFNIYL